MRSKWGLGNMPYPDWLVYSIEEQDFLHSVYEAGRRVSICVSTDSLYNYINSWGWKSHNSLEDSICLYKHIERLFHSGVPYSVIGINDSGVYYGENFFNYIRSLGEESLSSFSNLWVVWCKRYVVPVFELRSVSRDNILEAWRNMVNNVL